MPVSTPQRTTKMKQNTMSPKICFRIRLLLTTKATNPIINPNTPIIDPNAMKNSNESASQSKYSNITMMILITPRIYKGKK